MKRLLAIAVIVLASCGGADPAPQAPDPQPAPSVQVTTETGDRAGLAGQVDRARRVAGAVDDRNTSVYGE